VLRISPITPRLWAVLAAAVCAPGLVAAQSGAEPGRRIVDVVAELRERGVIVIYSDELLTDAMRIGSEPRALDPIEQLREILAPHALRLERGPRDAWLIVRAPEQSLASPPTQTAARQALAIGPPALEEIVVSASFYAISRDPSTSTSRIDRLQIENTPTLGEDALRTLHSLPGLTSSGLTARVNVRGGIADETQMFLDGVELYNPFHLKDFQGLFSTISPSILDSMTVYTGAYPAKLGDRMSSVIEMQTIEPEADHLYELGLSLFTTSVLGAGRFAQERGSWLASARRGNLDLLLDAANSDIGSPRYADLYSKLNYELSTDWMLSFGALALRDRITLNETTTASATADYDDTYLWAHARFTGESLNADILVSATELIGTRAGVMDDPTTSTGQLSEVKEFTSTALKADWTYRINERHLLSWGGELRQSDAHHRYTGSRSAYLPITIPAPLATSDPNVLADAAFDGNQKALYLSYRTRPLRAITAELGLRWDEQDYLDDRQFSPRVNMLFDLGPRAKLRASWGQYFQAQRLDEVQVNNGLTTLFPAQKSEHYVIGFEYLLGDGTELRIEAYRKELEHLWPRFENLFARVSLLPELRPDRVMIAPDSGEATGIELSATGERGRWRWWGSLSKARSFDAFGNGRIVRSWQEPWSVKAGAIRSGRRWDFAVTTNWHSGWPISVLTLVDNELQALNLNANRFGDYGSIDLRLSREVQLERSQLEWFVSLSNVLGRDNACCIDYGVEFDALGRPITLNPVTDSWYSIVPNAGVLWRFAASPR